MTLRRKQISSSSLETQAGLNCSL